MEHKNTYPHFSKAHLTNLNLSNFKMIEAMGLKIIASKSPWMALARHKISWKYTKLLKIISREQTDRQTAINCVCASLFKFITSNKYYITKRFTNIVLFDYIPLLCNKQI
jgi:hypothetical protein